MFEETKQERERERETKKEIERERGRKTLSQRERERGETSKIKDRIQMVALVKPETIRTQKQ